MEYPRLDWLIATTQVDPFLQMGQHFRRGGPQWRTMHLVLLLVVLSVLAAGAWFLSRYLAYRDGGGYNRPKALFAELCRAHGLRKPERRLLCHLAKAQGVSMPAQLFLEPYRFRCDQLEGDLRNRSAQVETLRAKLFGPQQPTDVR